MRRVLMDRRTLRWEAHMRGTIITIACVIIGVLLALWIRTHLHWT